jgi:hypothetical protein
MDLIVCGGDGFPHALFGRTRLLFEPAAQHRERHVRRLPAGGLSANAVDDGHDAAANVKMEAVLVHLAAASGIRLSGGRECHSRSASSAHK